MTVSGSYLNLRYSTFTSFGGFATFLNLCRYVGCFQKNEYLIDKAFILFDIFPFIYCKGENFQPMVMVQIRVSHRISIARNCTQWLLPLAPFHCAQLRYNCEQGSN